METQEHERESKSANKKRSVSPSALLLNAERRDEYNFISIFKKRNASSELLTKINVQTKTMTTTPAVLNAHRVSTSEPKRSLSMKNDDELKFASHKAASSSFKSPERKESRRSAQSTRQDKVDTTVNMSNLSNTFASSSSSSSDSTSLSKYMTSNKSSKRGASHSSQQNPKTTSKLSSKSNRIENALKFNVYIFLGVTK